MSNDERREKRVQASLKVRYKSATVTEFIEKHSHDISPGGVFIRSQKPLAKGSLLKIDFRLEDDTAVIQGVGRVVWTREPADYSEKPSGMGIKFIRLDENSKTNIHKIISMQKSGEKITRAAIYGEEAGDDEQEYESPPEGRSVRDSVAPSVDVRMSDDDVNVAPATDTAVEAAPDSASDTTGNTVAREDEDEPTKKIGVTSKSAPESSKSDKENTGETAETVETAKPVKTVEAVNDNEEETAPRTPRELTPTVTAAEPRKEKKNTGIVLVLLFIAIAAIGYFLLQTKDKGVGDDTLTDGAKEEQVVSSETAEPVEAEPEAEPEPEPEAEPEPEPEPATPLSGEVKITTDVEGATVTIDGAAQSDLTPLTIPSLEVGEHDLQFKLFGYEPLEQKIVAEEGVPIELAVKLEQARFVMQLKANVTGAKVFVGEKQIGRTPIKSVKRRNPDFEYVIMKPNYQDFTGKVVESDWKYEDGVYLLQIDATLLEEVKEPKVSVPEEKPKPRVRMKRPRRRVQPASEAAKTSSTPVEPVDVVEPEPKSLADPVPVEAKPDDAVAPKAPVKKRPIKAAGADDNPY